MAKEFDRLRTMGWLDFVRRAPCVPMVLVTILGILLDRCADVPSYLWPVIIGIGLIGWLTKQQLWTAAFAIAGFAALHHHLHCYGFPNDDIGHFAGDEPRLMQLRGRIAEPVSVDVPTQRDPLRSIPESARTHAIVDAQELKDAAGWHTVSGRVAVTLLGAKSRLNVGDQLQFTGWLARPRPPDNPGERDRSLEARDQRLRATFFVRHVRDLDSNDATTSHDSWTNWPHRIRNWSTDQLHQQLADGSSGLAAALLVGDTTALARQEWEKYIRTGVVHVLAVSGQHLSILAGIAWIILRAIGVRRRNGAAIIAIGIGIYSLMVGWHPPVLRATVMVVLSCWAVWLQRPVYPGNMMALALLMVLLLNPADIVDPGCHFSFLCMAILIWGLPNWLTTETDRLTKLEDRLRPTWVRGLKVVGRVIGRAYLVTMVFFVALAPLTAHRYHLLTPVGVLIGPPAIVLSSFALIAGFFLLLISAALPSLSVVVAPLVRWPLTGLSQLVDGADRLPGGWCYVGTIEPWFVIGFYLLIGAALWQPTVRENFRWVVVAGLAWMAIGLATSLHRPAIDGMTVTFLAVGHGGATVLEFPDGRVSLVDCGSMMGPEVTKRIIAPFLWRRGIRRIDEMFLSHADLDHFNGLPALLQRFSIGRVSVTPSFAAKPTPGVAVVMQELNRKNIPVAVRQCGDRVCAKDVEITFWHPPSDGPAGPENVRSMVMSIRHHRHHFVLTGDLDADGRSMVMSRPSEAIDVWLAPHHGGLSANPIELAVWAKPRIVVAHNATGEAQAAQENYERMGGKVFGTWPNGAIVIGSRSDGLSVQTYRSRQNHYFPDP